MTVGYLDDGPIPVKTKVYCLFFWALRPFHLRFMFRLS